MTNPTKTDSAVTELLPHTSRAVVTECDLPDAPEKVWKALTLPKLLAQWLPDAVDSEILATEPNRLVRYRWPGSDQDKDAAGRPLESVVTFELTGTSTGGTHLRVTHRVFASANLIPFGRRRQTAMAVLGGRKRPFALRPRQTGITLMRRAA